MLFLLKYLKKQKGGRLSNVATYKAYCQAQKNVRPDGWLTVNKTLKLPESSDIFGHVALANMRGNTVIIKVFRERDIMLRKEKSMLRFFTERNTNNIVKYICDVGCKDSHVKWENNINLPTSICNGSDDLHFVIMEYIHKGDLEEYLNGNMISLSILKSILKQICFGLLHIYFNYRIVHGDLHRGNILISKQHAPETLTYTFGKTNISIETLGVQPVFIDFGRSHRVEKNSSSNSSSNSSVDIYGYNINFGIEDVLHVIDIISNITIDKEQRQCVIKVYDDLASMKFDNTQTLQAVQWMDKL
jgi:serine/threonine protein kinase